MEQTVVQVARECVKKDMAYREWAALRGGVYVPHTEQTPANPYLPDDLERDAVTPSGRALTLVNPAYMNRMVFELEKKGDGPRGRITSLKPIRPQNAPDEWERKALLRMENGAREVFGFEDGSDGARIRFLKALNVEKECLGCHAQQGYKVGEVRGGLGVSIAWEPYRQLLSAPRRADAFALGLAWLTGLIGLSVSWQLLKNALADHEHADLEVRRLNAELERRVVERTAQLETANEELERAAKLKDRFLASVSHELRAPLGAVLGMATLLREESPGTLSPEALNQLSVIASSGNHLLGVVNDIIDVARIEAGKLDIEFFPCLLAEVGESALRGFRREAAEKGLEVSLSDGPPGLSVETDSHRLLQLLRCLLDNAAKFTPRGGRIGLDIAGDEEAGLARITVWDTGIGIAPEDVKQLFGAFVQLDTRTAPEYRGLGLGLALVQHLVKLLGASIEVKSEVGQGSRFIVTLPWPARRRTSSAAGG